MTATLVPAGTDVPLYPRLLITADNWNMIIKVDDNTPVGCASFSNVAGTQLMKMCRLGKQPTFEDWLVQSRALSVRQSALVIADRLANEFIYPNMTISTMWSISNVTFELRSDSFADESSYTAVAKTLEEVDATTWACVTQNVEFNNNFKAYSDCLYSRTPQPVLGIKPMYWLPMN